MPLNLLKHEIVKLQIMVGIVILLLLSLVIRNLLVNHTITPETVQVQKHHQRVLTGDIYVAGHERIHPDLCPLLGANLQLLILVSSSPSHFIARDSIRKTWGHYAARSDIAIAFFMGIPPYTQNTLTPKLEAEDSLYGDVITGRFIESRLNGTLKTISMLEWVDTYCPRTPVMLKTADNMFINVPKLINFTMEPSRQHASKTIWGKMKKTAQPLLPNDPSKHSNSQLLFPKTIILDFTTGPTYLLTTDTIKDVLAAAPTEPYLRLEAVFITGVLGSKLGIKRRHAREFYNRKLSTRGDPCFVQAIISVNAMHYTEWFYFWRVLFKEFKCLS